MSWIRGVLAAKASKSVFENTNVCKIMAEFDRQELVAAACDVQKAAHAPYSNFHVGAAVRTASGKIFAGCNVENASYGLTICAERVAISAAVSAGEQDFSELAIATTDGITPCGACSQFLAEFCEELPIFLIATGQDNAVREVGLNELLPDRFRK